MLYPYQILLKKVLKVILLHLTKNFITFYKKVSFLQSQSKCFICAALFYHSMSHLPISICLFMTFALSEVQVKISLYFGRVNLKKIKFLKKPQNLRIKTLFKKLSLSFMTTFQKS